MKTEQIAKILLGVLIAVFLLVYIHEDVIYKKVTTQSEEQSEYTSDTLKTDTIGQESSIKVGDPQN